MRTRLRLPLHTKELLTTDDVQNFKLLKLSKNCVYGNDGKNPLHLAAKYSPGTALAHYATHSLRINPKIATKRSRKTPLHYAAGNSNLALLLTLLDEFQVPVDPKKKNGTTPFLTAVKHCNSEIAKVLLAHGANINTVNMRGWNAAHWATRNGDLELLKHLIDQGIDYSLKTNDMESCLHLGAWSGQVALVQFLSNRFGPPALTNRGGYLVYLKGNWAALDWVLGNMNQMGNALLPSLLSIEIPAEIAIKHCSGALNVCLLLVYDRADLINYMILQGQRVLEYMESYHTLGPKCSVLRRKLQVWRRKYPLLIVNKLRATLLIAKLPSSLFRELVKYL